MAAMPNCCCESK